MSFLKKIQAFLSSIWLAYDSLDNKQSQLFVLLGSIVGFLIVIAIVSGIMKFILIGGAIICIVSYGYYYITKPKQE